MNLLQQIDLHRQGVITTIPFKHSKLSKNVFIGRKMYHLIGGAGGTGKSAFIDEAYILYPIKWYLEQGKDLGIKIKIFLRSMERSKEHRIAKWVCMYLYAKYKILIDTKTMLGWGLKKSVIDDDLYKLIVEAYDHIESLSDIVEIIDGVENPTGIYKHGREFAHNNGTLYYYNKEEQLIKIENNITKRAEKAEIIGERVNRTGEIEEYDLCTRYQPYYKPKDENIIVLYVLDNLQAMKKESGNSDKQNFDKMSEYFRIMRDLYHFSPIVVSQLNRGVNDTMRKIKTELLPQRSDFSGSDQMYSDSDMASILFNPYDYGLSDLRGWNIKACLSESGINRFRTLHVLKNSYGSDNQIYGFQFIGECGIFKELPHPVDMNQEDYQLAANPNYHLKLTST